MTMSNTLKHLAEACYLVQAMQLHVQVCTHMMTADITN